jgi:hypothetical protein
MRGKVRDWQVEQRRYLIHFSDGGSGMRFYDEPLEEGATVERGEYRVERVEQASYPQGLGRAWATWLEP